MPAPIPKSELIEKMLDYCTGLTLLWDIKQDEADFLAHGKAIGHMFANEVDLKDIHEAFTDGQFNMDDLHVEPNGTPEQALLGLQFARASYLVDNLVNQPGQKHHRFNEITGIPSADMHGESARQLMQLSKIPVLNLHIKDSIAQFAVDGRLTDEFKECVARPSNRYPKMETVNEEESIQLFKQTLIDDSDLMHDLYSETIAHRIIYAGSDTPTEKTLPHPEAHENYLLLKGTPSFTEHSKEAYEEKLSEIKEWFDKNTAALNEYGISKEQAQFFPNLKIFPKN